MDGWIRYEFGTFVLGGQGIHWFEPETHVRREANMFGRRSESPVSGGFTVSAW